MTQDEIARMAGVSRPTVSLAINHPDRLAPETLAKVLKVMESAEYVPDQTARNFQSGRSGLVGMVFRVHSERDFARPFLFQTLKGLNQATASRNLGLRFIPYELTIDLGPFFKSRSIDGGIYTTYWPEMDYLAVKSFLADGYPLVVFGKEPDIPCVDLDYHGGLMDAVLRLARRGRRRLLYLGGGLDRVFNREKFEGFQAGIEAAGLDPQVQQAHHTCWTLEQAKQTIQDLVDQGQTFDGVIAADGDFAGIGALHGLQSRDIRIPEQVSLVSGVGSYYAQTTEPPLTSIYNTFDQRAELALELLDNWIRTGKKPGAKIIPMGFVDGGTL